MIDPANWSTSRVEGNCNGADRQPDHTGVLKGNTLAVAFDES